MHSFLGLIPQGICPSQHRTALPSVIVSGLRQAGEVRQPRDEETSCRQNEDSGYVKAEGRGSITPFFYSPPSPSLWAFFMTMPVLGCSSLEESYLSLVNWSSSGPSRVKWAEMASLPGR